LEGFDRTRLNAIGLSLRQAALALFNGANADAWEMRKLSRHRHGGRAGAHNEHVHHIGNVSRAVQAVACCGFDARVF